MRHHEWPIDRELQDIVTERLTGLFREMENANWKAEEVAFALSAVLKEKWLDRAEALRKAQKSTAQGFVSDGNEG